MQHSTPKPNKTDVSRFEAFQRIGCIACHQLGFFSLPQAHHLLSGNVRRGHQFSIPLCPYHHVSQLPSGAKSSKAIATLLGPSLARESKRFHERFGTDDELLAKVNELIAARENLA